MKDERHTPMSFLQALSLAVLLFEFEIEESARRAEAIEWIRECRAARETLHREAQARQAGPANYQGVFTGT